MFVMLTNHSLLCAELDDQRLANVCLKFGLPPQNVQFTGRTKELQLLSDIVEGAGKGQRKIAVLHGLGGIGKTNIVIQYAWQNLAVYTSVWWIHSATAEVLKQSLMTAVQNLIHHLAANHPSGQLDYIAIACDLGITGLIDASGQLVYSPESDDQERVEGALSKWLSMDRNDMWLLVFDNVDDLKVVDRARHFPQSPSGTIIITSRRRGSVHLGTGSIQVEGLEQDDALSLLLTRASIDQKQLSATGE
jgi:AAA ATPase domain